MNPKLGKIHGNRRNFKYITPIESRSNQEERGQPMCTTT
jgi:hypothetical protein